MLEVVESDFLRLKAETSADEKTAASDHVDSSARPGGAAVGDATVALPSGNRALAVLPAVIFIFGAWLRFQGALWDRGEINRFRPVPGVRRRHPESAISSLRLRP